MTDDTAYMILSIVEEIPKGKVASYGQIAALSVGSNRSRLIGKVLAMSSMYGDYPCHRVVNHMGRLAPDFAEQKELLLEEGVTFLDNGCVDMKKHRWDPFV